MGEEEESLASSTIANTTINGNNNQQPQLPLRSIIRNFLNRVKDVESRRDEDELDLFDTEFLELKKFSESLKNDPHYECKEGEKLVNRKKNRYKDILPFDYTRVCLQDYGDVPGCDYVNANYIKGASGSSAYIACQGPLAHTLNEFWRMVIECEVQVIIMACNETEGGKHKCENYWVDENEEEKTFGQVTVTLKKCRNVCPDFLVRTMRIKYPNSKGDMEERNVCQFHYSAWPDHDVPKKVSPLLDMVRLVRDCQTSETLPMVIHCSAGCGRTGTICAIDYVWGLLRLGKLPQDFSLFNLVREMRRQRIAMVQTKDQYLLVHRAVKELFEEQLRLIDSHPYANVDYNGLPFQLKGELEEPTYETIEFQPLPSPSPSSSDNPPSNNNNELPPKVQKFNPFNSEEKKIKVTSTGGLLRKPSMNKLRALFEKTPKDHKKALSRTKSDVSSSRFYNLGFGARSPKETVQNSSGNVEKPCIKPKPLAQKLGKPIKRSKSLKITFGKPKEEESECANDSIGSNSYENSSPASNIHPIVVKQIQIPTSQPITSKSNVPQLQTAVKSGATAEKLNSGGNNRNESTINVQNGGGDSQSRGEWRKRGGNLSNSKEMEDLDRIRKKPGIERLRKYDTLNPKTMSSFYGLNQASEGFKRDVQVPNVLEINKEPGNTLNNVKSQKTHLFSSDLMRNPAKKDDSYPHMKKNEDYGLNISPQDDSPSNRGFIEKHSPLFSNYSPKTKAPTPSYVYPESYHSKIVGSSSFLGDRCTYNRIETLPLLKSVQGGSSESSSTATTPRDSLPSTPTQPNDLTFSQFGCKPALSGLKPDLLHSKSILKGSLSSTPSDSEERLVSKLNPPFFEGPQINPLNSLRLGLGVRERRNSFRKAVWKEAPASGGLITSPISHHDNSTPHDLLPGKATFKLRGNARDYEPIWPETCKNNGVESSSGSGYVLQGEMTRMNQMPNHGQSYKRNCSPKSNEELKLRNDDSFQHRVDEIKVLLEELGTPGPGPGPPGLKYNRSLRGPPTRPGPGPTSCFALRKPASMESLDQGGAGEARNVYKSRYANDYVALRHCSTEGETTGGFQVVGNSENLQEMPIPPPRTKKISFEAQPNGNDILNGPNCSQNVGNPQFREPVNSPTSPKALLKALGKFSKAANVITRFANWSEGRSRKQDSGHSSSFSSHSHSSDPNSVSNAEDGGFGAGSSVKSPTAISRSKHQYL